jgi:hypothetical protein
MCWSLACCDPRAWKTTDGDKRYTYHIDATEVGICLKHVTMKVAKTTNEAAAPTARTATSPRHNPALFASPSGAAHP